VKSSKPDFSDWLENYLPDRESLHAKQGALPLRRKDVEEAPITARLDIHGMVRAEADRRVRCFVRDARKEGHRRVLIIHGKGSNSQGPAVLGPMVRQILNGHPDVLGLENPPERLGGKGAVVVLLRPPAVSVRGK